MSDEQTPQTIAEPEWMFLIDPAWQPAERDERPPAPAVIGGWFVDADGTVGRFHANPDYQPAIDGSPTDPVDATLQLVTRGRADAEQLMSTLREAVVGVAVDADGNPVVDAAPDGVPCVLVTTAPAHRYRVDVSGWTEVSAGELADALPDEGIDMLLNPGAPASIRLLASAVKQALDGAPRFDPEPVAPVDPVGMLCVSMSFVGELSDEMAAHAADDLIDRVSYPATVQEFYPALQQVIAAGEVPRAALAHAGPHDAAQVLDFLRRLTAELERRRPWPEPALVAVGGQEWPSPRASAPIARFDVTRADLEAAVHAELAGGQTPFLVLRMRSGQLVGLSGELGPGPARFAVLLPDEPGQMEPDEVLDYLARYTGLQPVVAGAENSDQQPDSRS